MVPEKRVRTCTYQVCHMVPEQRVRTCTYQVCHMVPEQRVQTCTYQVCHMVPELRVKNYTYPVPHGAEPGETCTYQVCHMVPEQRVRTCTYQVCHMVPEKRVQTCTYQVCHMRQGVPQRGDSVQGLPHGGGAMREAGALYGLQAGVLHEDGQLREVGAQGGCYTVTRCVPVVMCKQVPVKVCCPAPCLLRAAAGCAPVRLRLRRLGQHHACLLPSVAEGLVQRETAARLKSRAAVVFRWPPFLEAGHLQSADSRSPSPSGRGLG